METSGGARDRARMEGRTHGEAAQEGEVQKHAIEESEDSDRVYAPICTSLCRRYTTALGCYGSGWLREDGEAAKDGSGESRSDQGAMRLVVEGSGRRMLGEGVGLRYVSVAVVSRSRERRGGVAGGVSKGRRTAALTRHTASATSLPITSQVADARCATSSPS